MATLVSLKPPSTLYETATLVAFRHPQPAYATHILLVPKRHYGSFMALNADDQELLADLLAAVQHLVRKFDLETVGYRLIVNGGPYQDVPQLHFHLISKAQTLGDD